MFAAVRRFTQVFLHSRAFLSSLILFATPIGLNDFRYTAYASGINLIAAEPNRTEWRNDQNEQRISAFMPFLHSNFERQLS